MNLANTSKRILPWFAVVCFLLSAIVYAVSMNTKLLGSDFEWINDLPLKIGSISIPMHQLLPFFFNLAVVILFFLVAMIGAVSLGISGRHCFFPTALGLLILLTMLPMSLQACLYGFKILYCIGPVSGYWCIPQGYVFAQSLCRLLYCLPVCVLAIYMIIAPFCKFKGWVIPVLTVAVILLTLVATLLLSFPLDYLQMLTARGRKTFFDSFERLILFEYFSFEKMTDSRLFTENAITEIISTWIILFFPYIGFLLYLPAALYRPKAQKTNK